MNAIFCQFAQSLRGGGGITWSKRLKNVLQQIESEYVIYLLEDFFLMSPVNKESLQRAIDLMKSDERIGYIGLKHNSHYDFVEGYENNALLPFFSKDEVKTINRVNSMSALWRREWLLSLIKEHETPWEFEIYGSIRSRRTPFKVMQINNYVLPSVFDYEVDYKYGYGVSQRKWLPKNKELFEKYGITVDFDTLGWLELKDNGKENAITKAEKAKGLRERLYDIKRYWRKIKKWFIKTERKIRSLI